MPDPGVIVMPVLVVISVPAEVFRRETSSVDADKDPLSMVKEPPPDKVVISTEPVLAGLTRPATASLNVTVLPAPITTAWTFPKSGTAPDTPKLPVTAQLAGSNHCPVVPPIQVTEL